MNDSRLKEVLRSVLSCGEKIASSTELGDGLIAAARKERMSPEQLGRMVNVLNVERTLAHHKTASDDTRGADLDLLDAPALMARYATEVEPAKTAATKHERPGWSSMHLGVGDHFKSPSTAEVLRAAEETDEWQKEASRASDVEVRLREKEARQIDYDNHIALWTDLMCELSEDLTKMARIAFSSPSDDTTQVLSEVTTMSPFVAEAFANKLDTLGYRVDRDKVAAVPIAADPFSLHPLVLRAEETLKLALCTKIAADDILNLPEPKKPKKKGAPSSRGGNLVLPSPLGGGPTIHEEPDEEEGWHNRKGRQPKDDVKGRSLLLHALTRESPAAPLGKVDVPQIDVLPGVTEKRPVDEQSKLMASLEAIGDVGSLVGSAVGGVGRTADSIANTLNRPHARDSTNSVVDTYNLLMGGRLNDKARKVSDSVMRLRQQITLTRLMKSDEIISRAKPGEVVALFNSIRNSNPAAATDVNITKLLLREALTHQGMPLNAVKTLSETRPTAPSTSKPAKP